MCTCTTENAKKPKKPKRPLSVDPTRTTLIRKQFEAALRKRFRKLKGDINRLLVEEDAFGLQRKHQAIKQNSATTFLQKGQGAILNQRFAFRTEPEQIAAFEKWLEDQVNEGLLGGVTRDDTSEAYWQAFAEAGYQQGAGRAFDDVRKPALSTDKDVSDFFNGTRQEFLRQSFGSPVSVQKLKILGGRVFTELRGIDASMSTQLSRRLTDGLAQGKNPRVIAKELTKVVDGNVRRAQTIAQTEIIRAHAEGQLDSLESLGVTEVGVMVEWSTAGDDRVCPLCQPMEGVVMTIKEARGLIPRHPRCRCSFIPANVGEPKDDKTLVHFRDPKTGEVKTQDVTQKRTKGEVDKAFDKSLKAQDPTKSLEDMRKRSRWAGADTKVAKVRPKSAVEPGTRERPKAPEKEKPQEKLGPQGDVVVKGKPQGEGTLSEERRAAIEKLRDERQATIEEVEALQQKNLAILAELKDKEIPLEVRAKKLKELQAGREAIRLLIEEGEPQSGTVASFLGEVKSLDSGERLSPDNLRNQPGLKSLAIGVEKDPEGESRIVIFDVEADKTGEGAFSETLRELKEADTPIRISEIQTDQFMQGLERRGFVKEGKNSAVWNPLRREVSFDTYKAKPLPPDSQAAALKSLARSQAVLGENAPNVLRITVDADLEERGQLATKARGRIMLNERLTNPEARAAIEKEWEGMSIGANSLDSVIAHEYGHIVDGEAIRGPRGIDKYNEVMMGFLNEEVPAIDGTMVERKFEPLGGKSFYAQEEPSEWVAEAFADVVINGSTAEPDSIKLVEILKSLL